MPKSNMFFPPSPPLIYSVLKGGRYQPAEEVSGPVLGPQPPVPTHLCPASGSGSNSNSYSRYDSDDVYEIRLPSMSMIQLAQKAGKDVFEVFPNQVLYIPWKTLRDRQICGKHLFGENLFIITGRPGAIVAVLPSPTDHNLTFTNPACSTQRLNQIMHDVVNLFYDNFEKSERDLKVTSVTIVVSKMYEALWAPGQLAFLDAMTGYIGLRPLLWGYDLINPRVDYAKEVEANPGRFSFFICGLSPERGVKAQVYVEDQLVQPISGVSIGLYPDLEQTG